MTAITIDAQAKGRLRREGSASLSAVSEEPVVSPVKIEKLPTQTKGKCHGTRTLLIVFLLSCIGSVMVFFDKESVQQLAVAFEENKNGIGMVAFFCMSVIAVLCFFPGPILSAVAGALYGKLLGTLIIWLAGTLSQSITFVLGKYLFRDALVAFVSKRYKSFPDIDAVIAQQGWKIILLLRLSPVIPDSVLNYVLATTSIPYVPYAISSSIAIVPWCIAFAYIGSFASDVSTAMEEGRTVSSKWLTLLVVASVVLLLVFGYLIARAARRSLTERLATTA